MDLITSRAIIGHYYCSLAAYDGASWVGAISNMFTSDQDGETYAWLGQTPAMREWIGGRHAKGFTENSITIKNKHFEATLDLLIKDMRRDKSGQIMARVAELAKRTSTHWASILSTLIKDGETLPCYDGQYFFDTDHEEGDSGVQSNLIDIDISAFPTAIHGVVTAPSVEEMQLSISTAISKMYEWVDDQGEPMNEDLSAVKVMVPVSLMNVTAQAIQTPLQVDASQTALTALKQDFTISMAVNPRLDWTDAFALFRTDSNIKSLIRQQETDVMMKAKAEGSEYEFDNDAHQYGVDAWRNVGFGMWQGAIKANMV